jgi:uncharacterized membrane protein
MSAERSDGAMTGDRDHSGARPPALLVAALWSALALLIAVGIGSALGRGVFRGDFATRADPLRQRVLTAFHREDPLESRRPEELDRFDGRYAANPVATLLHVLPGGVFLLLAPFQFSSRIRNRHRRFHRWSGRALLLVGVLTALAGFFFGLRMPYGGAGEVSAIALFGGLFVFALGRAFVAIRNRRIALHREWMIRAFAIAIGISTVRVFGMAFDVLLTPLGVPPPGVFVLALWTGWTVTLAVGELWIRYTRPYGLSLSSPAGGGLPIPARMPAASP